MKINSKEELEAFLEACKESKGDIFLESIEGDRYNMKSYFNKYIAISNLIQENAEDLELYCANKEDEPIFLQFFDKYPGTLSGKHEKHYDLKGL